MMVIISAIARLERHLIIERIKSGLRLARLEDRQIGRRALAVSAMPCATVPAGGVCPTIAKLHPASHAPWSLSI